MAISIVINYPETEEGMKMFEERQAQAFLKILRRKLPKEDLDLLIKRLEEMQSTNIRN
ncbi:hypothetical protein [Candidatus Clostridium stratigraminis]|uniref:Uncharacterized protein n=1 Tax=Candidatus Clostridium stratigraminis TaxID=3381661 RepID=A0ABW8SYE1_9CLOT